MNNFDLKCYRHTYNNPNYWDGEKLNNEESRRQIWQNCRQLTDNFYNELILRGYLVLKISSD
ncbi:hypothetical protein [Crocosphaera sp. XPORK-15E]|uniref:hypothetical protein n=1 Tax=Crocosphaera sp. XPORK-15E TaxID=3110247 RepID=UPI002B1F0759|nr:hypothetical protein [Crocosphaera sp. XPORK-15E]MEA5535357.1 hypothetical protein [Crocosphaera sp. XPORK-15E]